MGALLDAARKYVARGLAVIPVPRGTKIPVLPEWQKLRLTEAELPEHFAGGGNIGVLNGEPSAGLVDVDLDAPEAVFIAPYYLPPTDLKFGRASKRLSHWYYKPVPLLATQKFADPSKRSADDKGMLVELRSTGSQTIWPPSRHPEGEAITFASECEPASVCADVLLAAGGRVAAAALLARHWPTKGMRHEVALALSGMFLRSEWDLTATTTFLEAVARAAGDEEWQDRLEAARSTAENLRAGKPVTGMPRLMEMLDHRVVGKLGGWLGLQRVAAGSSTALPIIRVNGRPLRDVTADALAALVAANEPPEMFVRFGALARVRQDEKGRPIIETMAPPVVRHRLARVAECIRVGRDTNRGGVDSPVAPPKELVEDVLALGQWPALPPLEAVTEVPVLRADGSVHDRPGYDPATRLVYAPTPSLVIPAVSATPSAEDVHAARDLLLDIIAEFPFVDQAARANALALLLTPPMRPAIPGPVPLALIDKPKRGTGASLVAFVIEAVAIGKVTDLMTAPHDDEEWRKKITAALLSGSTIMFFDNVEHPLSSPSLAAALTAPEWADRVLGRSEIVRLPQRATWMATGNNLRVGGDIARRSYWIRLDAQQARPWQRKGFRHENLLSYVLTNRGCILAAALTLARAWFTAGCPKASVPKLGGFEGWAETVGGVLAHVGIEGFLGNLDDFYAQVDGDEGAWEGFLAAWWAVYQDAVKTVGGLVDDLRQAEHPLRGALPEDLVEALDQDGRGRVSFSKRLGQALSKRVDAVFGSCKLVRLEREQNTTRWKVVQAPARDCRDCGDCVPPPTREEIVDSLSSSHTKPAPESAGINPHNPSREANGEADEADAAEDGMPDDEPYGEIEDAVPDDEEKKDLQRLFGQYAPAPDRAINQSILESPELKRLLAQAVAKRGKRPDGQGEE